MRERGTDEDYCFWIYTHDFTLTKMNEVDIKTGNTLKKRKKKIKKERTFRE